MKLQTIINRINKMGFHARLSDTNRVTVSAEHNDNAADYYGEFRGGYPWINPKLEKFAESLGAYWEWDSPGSISLSS